MNTNHLTDHVDDGALEDAVTLQSMMAYAGALDDRTTELKALEAKVKAKKKEVNKLKDTLPAVMSQLGMSSMTMKNGHGVDVKEDINCTVVDIDKLYSFLEKRGDAALVRTSLDMGKIPKSILNIIIKLLKDKFDIEATGGLKIHPQTLNGYFRKLCGVGADTKCTVPVGDLDEEMVVAYLYNKVTVKVK